MNGRQISFVVNYVDSDLKVDCVKLSARCGRAAVRRRQARLEQVPLRRVDIIESKLKHRSVLGRVYTLYISKNK